MKVPLQVNAVPRTVKILLYILLAIFLFFLLEIIIEVILMGCGVIVQEKLVPYMYDSEIKRNKLKEHFRIDNEKLNNKVHMGIQNIKNKKIVICALARDVEKCFPKCIDKIMLFTEGFENYNIIIYENDSKDRTRELLREWAQRNKKVKLMDCCEEGNCDCKLKVNNLKLDEGAGALSYQRIKKMAYFRNKYLDYVKKNYKDYDYMMVIDIDIRGGVFKEGFQSCFADDDWDAIFAKGIKPFPFLFGSLNFVYDTLAFVDNKSHMLFDMREALKIWFRLQNVYNKKIGDSMEVVRSAFNGAGIYRIKTIIDSDAKYDSITPCEHIDFHDSLKSDKLYASPSFIINMGIDNETQLPFNFVISILK